MNCKLVFGASASKTKWENINNTTTQNKAIAGACIPRLCVRCLLKMVHSSDGTHPRMQRGANMDTHPGSPHALAHTYVSLAPVHYFPSLTRCTTHTASNNTHKTQKNDNSNHIQKGLDTRAPWFPWSISIGSFSSFFRDFFPRARSVTSSHFSVATSGAWQCVFDRPVASL